MCLKKKKKVYSWRQHLLHFHVGSLILDTFCWNIRKVTGISYLLSINLHDNNTHTNSSGNCQQHYVSQELLQVLPWRMHHQPFELHRARGEALLQASPHPADQGEGELQPAREWSWEDITGWIAGGRRSRVLIFEHFHRWIMNLLAFAREQYIFLWHGLVSVLPMEVMCTENNDTSSCICM